MARNPGFIAINRNIFEHPLFRDKPHWIVAWQYLIAAAAWKPESRRFGAGVVHVERGQTALTIRQFAEQINLGRSSVSYLLRCLEYDGMIEQKVFRTIRRTSFGIKNSHSVTVITICNYDKFQTALRGQNKRSGQDVDRALGQDLAQCPVLPGLIAPLTTKPLNHRESEKGSPAEVTRQAPRHGTQSSKHKTIYLYKGTEDWRVHAQDYRDVMGAEPLPDRHGGFWFYVLGEAVRPAHQRHWGRPQRGWHKVVIEKPSPVAAGKGSRLGST